MSGPEPEDEPTFTTFNSLSLQINFYNSENEIQYCNTPINLNKKLSTCNSIQKIRVHIIP